MSKMKITKSQLDQSLDAWKVARETAALQATAWGLLNTSHQSLIDSLLMNGHSWSEAQVEFQGFSEAHREAWLKALVAMDQRCEDYRALRAKYLSQQ